MQIRKMDQGIEVHLPEDFDIVISPVAAVRGPKNLAFSGAVPMPADPMPPGQEDAIINALKKSDMELVQTIRIAPNAGERMNRSVNADAGNAALVQVDLTASEDAVVLIEQDGMYLWKYPDQNQPLSGSRKRGMVTDTTSKRLVFEIEVSSDAGTATTKRNIFSQIREFGLGIIKAYVLKFAARETVSLALDLLEKDIRPGFIHIRKTMPDSWNTIESLDDLYLPEDRPARILLFVHGTFSTTVSAFGALGGTPWGEALLTASFDNYDAVLGFDHLTLKEDPLVNAQQLLVKFNDYKGKPVVADIITHSRGSLVVRSVVEKLLPQQTCGKLQVNRVVFAGSTNEGTLLAEPGNWESMIDLYTNLVVATSRVIGLISPQTKVVTTIVSEVIKNIGSFVKYCAAAAITDRLIPGLAAMEPGGAFIKDINLLQNGQPGIDNSYYCIITSDFKPSLTGDHEPTELPKRLLALLGGGFMKQLMQEANDLVVNTKSMAAIDTAFGDFVKEKYEFGINTQVYHTNYFTRPEVSNALARWLKLKPAVAETVVRGKGGPAVAALPSLPAYLPVMPNGVSPSVDTDILLFNGDGTVGDLRSQVSQYAPSYVVVTRKVGRQQLNYAFKGEEVLDMMTGKKAGSVLEAFNLHQANASGTQQTSEALTPALNAGELPAEHRNVVMAGDTPVGVTAERSLPDAIELAAIAKTIHQPADDAGKILRRRTMPTFTAQTDKRDQAMPDTKITAPAICHIHAEMDASLPVEATGTLLVTVSREAIEKAINKVSAEGAIAVEASKKLIITVIAKRNLILVNQDGGRAEIDLPAEGMPTELYFDVQANGEGAGEIWVIARQGQIPILKLVLNPLITAANNASAKKIVSEKTGIEPKPFFKPVHQLWIEESDNGNGATYKYIIYSAGLKINKSFTSRAVKGDRGEYVSALYKKIEDRWISSNKDQANFLQELRAFGKDLLDELIPDDLQKVLWDKRNDFDSIQVISSEPFIPWELIHLKDPSKKGMPDETRFLGQMGLIRWLEGAGKDGWPPEQIKIRNGSVHYVIPKYPHPDYVLPEAEKEKGFLENTFGAVPVTPESGVVRNLLSKPGQFDLLHFACHGIAEINKITDAALLMEGRVENGKYIVDPFSATTAKSFSNLEAEDNTPMVVLNACQAGRAGYKLTGIGGFADAFLSAGAGAFIGTLWSVGDSPARTFTETLYASLKAGDNLSAATVKARNAAMTGGEATWLAYVVYGHPHMTIV